MTQAELDKKISDINRESASTEEKQRRIKILNDTYSNNQTRLADEAKTKQQKAVSFDTHGFYYSLELFKFAIAA